MSAATSPGRVAIVTGAGGGIGSASARLLAADGAALALIDLRLDAAEAVAQEINAAGGEAVAIAADVSNEAEVVAAVVRTVDTFGRVNVLVNNAGMAFQGSIVETSVEDWDRVQAVNLRGTFLFMKHAAPAMADGGAIVNIASVAALMVVREAAAYTAAKGGVLSLSRMAAGEFAPRLRVNCICPGTVRTDMPAEMLRKRGAGDIEAGAALTAQRYLAGRLGEADEIARTVLFLATSASSFLTGSVITVDGGVTAQ